ncbi:uncharacterized protein LOC135702971 [Ochlerotatus camptorhynchus]|uniref:uncharacterized protein LOC135702971 n=1 Tax=Ochlerotatus camptorhynchus TaxID=644619 RepID=UPI0031DCF75D
MKKKLLRPIVREFIELYKSLPCLWKVQCKQYADRPMKIEAYKLMAKKLSEMEPDANRVSVIRKINNLRSNYRKEKRKIRAAELSGGLYEPSLWYYHLLEFLDGHDDSDTDSIDIRPVKVQLDSPPRNDNDEEASSQPPTEATFELALMNGSPSESMEMYSCLDAVNSRKRKCDDVLNIADHDQIQIGKCEDRHDAFGHNIAFKLRALPDEQRIYVEKLINDAIFEAELGNLNRHCRIQLGEN